MQAILTLLGSMFAKIFADKVLGWVALKLLLIFLFTIIVPIVLNNFLYDIMEIFMNFANNQIGNQGIVNGAMTFSGFSAWLITVFRLPECLAVIISAMQLRVILTTIPLVRMV